MGDAKGRHFNAVGIRQSERCIRESPTDRLEPFAVALPTRQTLEVPDRPGTATRDAADEDLGVVGARVTALVAEGRVLAFRAEFEWPSRSYKLVAAVPTDSEHVQGIGIERRSVEQQFRWLI